MSCAQVAGSLTLEIKNDSIQFFKREETITLSLKFTNEANSDLLLYGFEGWHWMNPDIEEICNLDKKSAGFAIFIFDQNNRAKLHIPMSIDYKPMPISDQKLTEILRQHKLKYTNEVRVIKPFETINVVKDINIKEYNLEKGRYEIQVVYVSGNGVKALVGKEQIEQDQLINGAELYQGCVMSNRVVLHVE